MTDCNTWTELHGKFYRRLDVYSMHWDNVDLENLIVIAAPYGGLIATTRDRNELQRAGDTQRPTIDVYTQSGMKIAQKLWEGPLLIGLCWTSKDTLLTIDEEGTVTQFPPSLSKPIGTYSIAQELGGAVVHSIRGWGNGFVALTSNLQFVAVTESHTSQPRVYSLSPSGLSRLPLSWAVLPPTDGPGQRAEEQSPIVYCATEDTLLAIDSAETRPISKEQYVPIVKMGVSEDGRMLACCTTIGTISVYSSDFARCFVEFQTSPTQYRAYQSALSQCEPGMPFDAAPFACARLPAALRWCGLDCVAAHYPQGVPSQADDDGEAILIVGPFDDSIVYQYDQPLALVQEMDGLRIITATNSEFLQCVPKSTASVFAMSSTAPGALLYEAVEAFNLRSARSYDLVRQIRDELTRAVDDCLEAASHEFSHSAQRALLKAASFGKSFLDFYTPEKFAEMCKTLRVLNAVREFDIGLPITIGEYIKLSAEGLVMRLVAMKHFLLAIRICDYLEMYNLRNDVVLTWACLKVNSGGSDAELCKAVSDTLRDYPGVSFAKVAETAFIEAGRKELALKLLELDPSPAQQVPLLLQMQQSPLALAKAMDSGDTDLVFMVLRRLLAQGLPLATLVSAVRGRQGAMELLLTYAKACDMELYKKICVEAELPTLQAANLIRDIFYGNSRTLDDLLAQMQTALRVYESGKGAQFEVQMTEDFLRLLLTQRELTTLHNETFLGISVNDTIIKLLCLEDYKSAQRVASDFRVPPKTYWLLRLRAIGTIPSGKARIGLIAKLAKEKSKPPCGWEPFVKACVEANEYEEAEEYVSRLSDLEAKVEAFVKYKMWTNAIGAARSNRDLLADVLRQAPPKEVEAARKIYGDF